MTGLYTPAEEDGAMHAMTMRMFLILPGAGAGEMRTIPGSGKNVRAGRKKRQWKIVLEDIDSWDKYTFTFYDTVGIGRGKDGSMYEKYLPVTGDGRVSKIHCVIIHKGDKLYLKDEGSRNGTYLNGERLEGPVVIQRDDIIGVGESRFEVQRILRESE